MNPLGSYTHPMIQQLQGLLSYARSFATPQAFMQELSKNNPQLAQTVAQLAQTVKNPEQYAIQMLAQQGINPQQISSLLTKK